MSIENLLKSEKIWMFVGIYNEMSMASCNFPGYKNLFESVKIMNI